MVGELKRLAAAVARAYTVRVILHPRRTHLRFVAQLVLPCASLCRLILRLLPEQVVSESVQRCLQVVTAASDAPLLLFHVGLGLESTVELLEQVGHGVAALGLLGGQLFFGRRQLGAELSALEVPGPEETATMTTTTLVVVVMVVVVVAAESSTVEGRSK